MGAGPFLSRRWRKSWELLEARLLQCELHDIIDFPAEVQQRAVVEASAHDFVAEPTAESPALAASLDGDLSSDPAVVGQWTNPFDIGIVAVHATLLPNSKIIYWDYTGQRLYDPATNQVTVENGPGYVLYCSGHAQLGDGRLLVSGGQENNGDGLAKASIYDAFTDTWTPVPDMNGRRWYPTNTTLPSGDVMTISGSYYIDAAGTRAINQLPQVYDPDTNTWRDLTDAKRLMPMYPFMFTSTNGEVYDAGPEGYTRYIDTDATGEWIGVNNSSLDYREYGTGVMYKPGHLLLLGGEDFATGTTASAETIDLTTGEQYPAFHQTDAMGRARKYLNATILPDGTVLATGGTTKPGVNDSTGATTAAEVWNPNTGHWTQLASSQTTRVYHSTALLLPDGRIMSMGSGRPSDAIHGDPDHTDAEIYSPPYLFKGARPTITTAPSTIDYRSAFSVATPDANAISRVTLVRLGSTTHAINMDQRFEELSFSKTDSGHLQINGPHGATTAPPGYYMLTVLNGQGVPSVSKIVKVADTALPTVASKQFLFDDAGPQRVKLQFSEDVSSSDVASAITLKNLSTNTTLPASSLSIAYDWNTDQATIRMNGPTSFPNGRYRLTVGANAITDWAGHHLAANATYDFQIFAGDTNSDAAVDFTDVLTLSQNYKHTSTTWSKGDFNYDGKTDFNDLLILAQNYGSTLPTTNSTVESVTTARASNGDDQTVSVASDVLN